MQRGAHACIYDIQWKSRPESKKRWIGLLISAGAVIALSFIGNEHISTVILFFMIVTAASGWFIGRHLELKQEISERAKDSVEQQDALAFVTKANDERFEELLEAKQATERTVEERTRELRQASKELEVANIQLKSLDELKSQFIANVS